MNSKETYDYILKELKEINPELCHLIEYLYPYFVFQNTKDERNNAGEEISKRHPEQTPFSKYYDTFYPTCTKYDEYQDKREYFIVEGKRVLDIILKENANFKDLHARFTEKLKNFPNKKDYRTLKKVYDQFMIQLVYRCAEENISYWGHLNYTTNVYNFLVNSALAEIREHKEAKEQKKKK